MYDSIHITFWKRQNQRDGKQINGCQRFGEEENLTRGGTRDYFQWDRTNQYASRVVDTGCYAMHLSKPLELCSTESKP